MGAQNPKAQIRNKFDYQKVFKFDLDCSELESSEAAIAMALTCLALAMMVKSWMDKRVDLGDVSEVFLNWSVWSANGPGRFNDML